jgi:hypothetical protein
VHHELALAQLEAEAGGHDVEAGGLLVEAEARRGDGRHRPAGEAQHRHRGLVPLEVNDEQLATSVTTAGRSTPVSPP